MLDDQRTIQLAPSRYVTIELASTLTGRSPAAIRAKIARGEWIEGREYIRAPDHRITVDLRGYEKWVEKAAA